MKKTLKASNAVINEFSYCPHHPNAINRKYRRDCYCRKPKPGMINKIIKNWKIDKNQVFLLVIMIQI